ncbi:MAG: DUF1566 domain-containing protein [Epsilonproteobacteria bacterium]|nr:MAG: DUF1566 domain-containing protein [Campylobacterota bacterium]
MRKIVFFLLSVGVLVAGEMAVDSRTGLTWQDNRFVESERVTYAQAEKLCKELRLGKHNDWRIPTIRELLSIIDYKKYDPAILDGFSVDDASYYWSSTQYMGDPDKVWGIDFKDGAADANGKAYDRRIRCVRATTSSDKK